MQRSFRDWLTNGYLPIGKGVSVSMGRVVQSNLIYSLSNGTDDHACKVLGIDAEHSAKPNLLQVETFVYFTIHVQTKRLTPLYTRPGASPIN